MIRFSEFNEDRKLRVARGPVQGLIEFKDTHRPRVLR
jgi:hypothetical protein